MLTWNQLALPLRSRWQIDSCVRLDGQEARRARSCLSHQQKVSNLEYKWHYRVVKKNENPPKLSNQWGPWKTHQLKTFTGNIVPLFYKSAYKKIKWNWSIVFNFFLDQFNHIHQLLLSQKKIQDSLTTAVTEALIAPEPKPKYNYVLGPYLLDLNASYNAT